MAKYFSKRLLPDQLPIAIDNSARTAQEELIANPKLILIMCSNTFTIDEFRIVDLVQVYIVDVKSKYGTLTSRQKALSIDT